MGQPWPVFRHGRKRPLAVFRFSHLIVVGGQPISHDLPIVLLIFDHKDALGHACLACSFTLTGRRNETVAPWPTIDSTQIFPPCISMIRLEIASPRPVPPFLRVIELSAC